ncbi:MAG: hypothetical protein DWQ37_15255 [Planctomycetota bacterium]|nr:MAG: hypothetical protein DWQ37_15255 [Planctomycetota bacterium]
MAPDDPKARAWIRENFEFCAHNHQLAGRLLRQFGLEGGSLTAVVPEWVDITQLVSYRQGSVPPSDLRQYSPGTSPKDELTNFVVDHLRTAPNSAAVCEHSSTARQTLQIWTWSPPPEALDFGNDDVYFLLTPDNAGPDTIRDALGDSLGHWGIAVCTSYKRTTANPDRDRFIDEIVSNTKHILMPAFDDDGYLIWSVGAGAAT